MPQDYAGAVFSICVAAVFIAYMNKPMPPVAAPQEVIQTIVHQQAPPPPKTVPLDIGNCSITIIDKPRVDDADESSIDASTKQGLLVCFLPEVYNTTISLDDATPILIHASAFHHEAVIKMIAYERLVMLFAGWSFVVLAFIGAMVVGIMKYKCGGPTNGCCC